MVGFSYWSVEWGEMGIRERGWDINGEDKLLLWDEEKVVGKVGVEMLRGLKCESGIMKEIWGLVEVREKIVRGKNRRVVDNGGRGNIFEGMKDFKDRKIRWCGMFV